MAVGPAGIRRPRWQSLFAEFRVLFEQAPDAYYLNDLQGNFVAANLAAEVLVGYKREEMIGQNFLELSLLPKEELTRAAKHLAQNVLGDAVGPESFTLNRKDGSQVQVEIRTAPVRIDGRFLVLGIARDVTEHRELERRLRASTESFAAIVEENDDGILVTDDQGIVHFANPAACRLLGGTRDKLEGSPFELLGPAEEEGHFEIPAGVGELGVVEIRRLETTWQGKPARLFTLREVTERKKLEEQLRQAQKMEAVGQLTGGIAHDFNNLLTVISTQSELSLAKLGPEDPSRSRLEAIQKATERAASLTHQLLAFSRQQILRPTVLDLNTVVGDFQKLLHRTIGEDIELATALDPKVGRVKADPGQIEQVLLNLAVNARDGHARWGEAHHRDRECGAG